MPRQPSLDQLARQLADGATTAADLVEQCLARIDDANGEGATAFLTVNRDAAREAATAIDKLRAAGAAPSPYAGIPISIKDLFDILGDVTRAGSKVLQSAAPAARDATAVARLRQAGFIIIGRTNMTEFAFSGLGVNPHYGTPRSPYERSAGRVAGGSSSGGAVSVADGMAHVGLGTDTGGSCRIPAAFCGIVGYKPTARRVPTDGAVPLSSTLDSVGPLARTVACCAAVDAVLAGETARDLVPASPARLTVAVPQNLVLGDMDEHVARHFERALSTLSKAGVRIEKLAIPEFDDIPKINAKGGFAPPEALAWHRPLIETGAAAYDPRVLVRINRGQEQTALDYLDLLAARAALIERVSRRIADFDALAMPTAPIIAPRLVELETDEGYARINLLALRNPTVINMLDGCAISIPMQAQDEPPTGLMLATTAGRDHHLFRLAATIEAALETHLGG